MSFTLTSSQCLKNNDSDVSTDNLNDELTDGGEKQGKASVHFNYSLENQMPNTKKVQNTALIPQELRESDKVLKLNKKTDECDIEKFVLDNSPNRSPSSKHCDSPLDENVCKISAASHSMPCSSLQITSIDGFFNRKRGRPPKNRFVEVYKNTHQKPQAIFTSFKLEKQQGVPDTAVNYENSNNHCPQSYMETIRNFATNLSDEHNTPTQKKVHKEDIDNEYNEASDSGPALKASRLCATTENVTVIRAAGTFYPENSNGGSKAKEGILPIEKDVAQNLSLKGTIRGRATNSLESSRSASSMTADRTSPLTQIYNVLRMQQQLFAFYQQLALMAPAFLHLDLKRFIAPTVGHTTLTDSVTNSLSSLSSTTAPTCIQMDLLHNKHLLSRFLNLQRHQANQKGSGGGELAAPPESKTKGRVRQLHRNTTTTIVAATTTTSTKDHKRTQSTTTSFDISSKSHFTTERKLQFKCSKERKNSRYLRFHFNEDCGYEKCSYRQHQSHFHCDRADCLYSFCDKTRFVQHTARHERLDSLMGSDFQQYRATTICNYTSCPFAFNAADNLNDMENCRKSSHFHCLKCPFVCADTNKVAAHRRLHNKMEFVRLAGFRMVTSNENCMISNAAPDSNKYQEHANVVSSPDNTLTPNFIRDDQMPLAGAAFEIVSHCPYALRHAHYHCLVCNCSVLSRSQLLAHKHRNSPVSNSTLNHENQVCSTSKRFENPQT